VVDHRFMAQSMRRGPQSLCRDAKAGHHVVETSQIAFQAVARIAQVCIVTLNNCLGERQSLDALR